MSKTIIGIDPGIIHTGLVHMDFRPIKRTLFIDHEAIPGGSLPHIQKWLPADHVFIEGYRPRSHFQHDSEMKDMVRSIQQLTGGKVLNNMGIKKIVTSDLMKVLQVWKFPTVTHHQDLRSAARIALLGMYKDPQLNQLVVKVLSDYLNGDPWHVHS